LTSITELNRSALIEKRCAPLLDASRRMAAPPIRNVATAGGNIASAVPCADLPPILMALYAEVEIWSPTETRRLPIERFFHGPRATALKNDEILAAILVPRMPGGFGAAYERFGLREGNAIAVASVAASLRLEGDEIAAARLVLGAVAPIPKSVEEACEALVGHTPDGDAFQEAARIAKDAAEPISDVRGTAKFRRDLVEVLTFRALAKALARAREAGP
jgi:carbon-monoxide dehydrogenase medium subunit